MWTVFGNMIPNAQLQIIQEQLLRAQELIQFYSLQPDKNPTALQQSEMLVEQVDPQLNQLLNHLQPSQMQALQEVQQQLIQIKPLITQDSQKAFEQMQQIQTVLLRAQGANIPESNTPSNLSSQLPPKVDVSQIQQASQSSQQTVQNTQTQNPPSAQSVVPPTSEIDPNKVEAQQTLDKTVQEFQQVQSQIPNTIQHETQKVEQQINQVQQNLTIDPETSKKNLKVIEKEFKEIEKNLKEQTGELRKKFKQFSKQVKQVRKKVK